MIVAVAQDVVDVVCCELDSFLSIGVGSFG